MVFEDRSSPLFHSSSTNHSQHLENVRGDQQLTFLDKLREWNWFWAPSISHMAAFWIILSLGLIYDGVHKPRWWNTLSFLIFGLINIAFPVLFTLQRKLETNTWSRRGIWACFSSCCRTEPDEEHGVLLSSAALGDEYATERIRESRPYERIFKYLLFKESKTNELIEQEVNTNPPLSFVTFHLWLGIMSILLWIWLSFGQALTPMAFLYPTYILLGVASLFVWRRGCLVHGLISGCFLLSSIFFHLSFAGKDFSVIGIAGPLFAFPIALILGSIAGWVLSNSKLIGIGSLILSSFFTTWFLFMIGFIHNVYRPANQLKILAFPASLTAIPAGLILIASSLSLFVRLV